jgi:hypothetical protein
MTLDHYTPPTPATLDHGDIAVKRLGEWATAAQSASVISEQLVRTSFVPEAFRGKPYEATAAILAGLEIGLSPMAALRSFDVIQGQAAPRALTLRAVVQSHGHKMELEESTATRCKMKGRRRDDTAWQTITWTIDRAKQLGLLGKHNWKVQPQAMLLARATSELARLIAADAILGIGYSAEELADGATGEVLTVTLTADPATGEIAPVAEAGTRKMSRRKPTEPAPPDDDIVDAEVVTDGPSEPQTKKVMALFNEQGIKERTERLAYISSVIGREVETWKDTTKAEASTVIESLVAMSVPTPEDADDGPALFDDEQP